MPNSIILEQLERKTLLVMSLLTASRRLGRTCDQTADSLKLELSDSDSLVQSTRTAGKKVNRKKLSHLG